MHENASMFLILDGNNLAWAGYYGLERAMKPDDDERRERVAILGLAGMALGAIARCGEPPGTTASGVLTRVAVCFDEGRPLRRRALFPAYQTGREGDPKFMQNEPTILRAVAQFCEICMKLPVEVLRGANTEADDLIAALIDANPTVEKRIVSSDKDFLQLIGPNTTVYSPIRKVVIDEGNLFDAVAPRTSAGKPMLFPRDRFLDYRALSGDPSDNLPGVPGVGPLSAAKLLSRAPLDDYFGNAQAVRLALERKSLAIEQAFNDGSATAIVARNRELMDLRLAAPCWDDLPSFTTRGVWDPIAFSAWLEQQRIASVDSVALIARFEELAAGR